jgi:hypothetical protein
MVLESKKGSDERENMLAISDRKTNEKLAVADRTKPCFGFIKPSQLIK